MLAAPDPQRWHLARLTLLGEVGCCAAWIGLAVVLACGGSDLEVGRIEAPARSAAAVTHERDVQRSAARDLAAPRADSEQILFGDLHVHSSFSVDAFAFALPVFTGDGAHPPADACDFARHCSQLDFFALTDHAEGLTPERWRASLEMLRACDARSGDPDAPDLIALAGWEWTQVGVTPETHYGHKNVILRGLDPSELPAHPIAYLPQSDFKKAPPLGLLRAAELALPGPYDDFLWWIRRLAELRSCTPEEARDPASDCRETADTPAELFAKLDAAGVESLVIPHGLAWGAHAPPGSRFDNQLTPAMHDPARQRLLEVYSGHGNSELYRREFEGRELLGETPVCPAPTPGRLPCCWRAGELMRARCGSLPAAECEERVREAQQLALAAGVNPVLVFPDTEEADWLDCDQCRDCFKPALSLRAGESAQYALAISTPASKPGEPPLRFRAGLIASSDDHHARAGTGYKQLDRGSMSDARGLRSEWMRRLVRSTTRPDALPDRAVPGARDERSLGALFDVERGASFFYPGGLVAAHVASRSRSALWEALQHREVYGTSGPRILLWFDLLNGPAGRAPMGSEISMTEVPRFEIRALGDSVQRPGCPAESVAALSPERLTSLCRNECRNPSEERIAIQAIEVVRIRPQRSPDEDVAELIEDPWRRFECPLDPTGCRVQLEDADFATAGRDAVYYVRALQAPTPAVNGANLRSEQDAAGNTIAVTPCYGDGRTPAGDDCLAPVQERAWSSPIFVDYARRGE